MYHSERLNALRSKLAAARVDCLLITSLPNIYYLTGFTGSAGVLLVDDRDATLFTDGRYRTQSAMEVRGARVAIPKQPAKVAVGRATRGYRRIGFEVSAGYRFFHMLAEAADGRRVRAIDGAVEQLRLVKQPDEIEAIRRAVQLNSRVFEEALPLVRPDVEERELAAEMEYRMRRYGGERPAFETIVAAGPHGALPHARASSRRLAKNEFLVLDHGVILAHYASDMTRTVYLGSADHRARTLYGVVKEAQQLAVSAVRAGVSCAEVDRAARQHIARCGYDKLFTHSTGHGIGIEVHEIPRIAGREKTKLPPGAVVTIEPGIYVPDYGGIRIEDVVVVHESGAEVLTPTRKDLIEL